ncbi:gliding motility-associated-like protein [Flavobacterium sp. 103]|uniref:gliding motility-associated C-terminal domain-containing protein n=1 Tax=Flavobacterium sp. 103 TaxID=2135624 RepID=UPI000D5CF97F|nr:gliding motility-associated C-terminal domain-containing protein [Flavobacterium sp. 103]PVX47749.1 gliding motility-associated-like protein [Flavobacterium sp. 103]
MVPKLRFPTHFTFYSFLTFFILFFCSIDVNAQCAGIAGSDNNSLNVCNIADPSSASVDLNLQLGPHTIGGTWSDDNKSLGLSTTTGFLNAQQIKKSGIYNYTYTVSDGLGCTDSAVVTVTIGGYAGIAGPDFSVCNNESLNLFKLFKGVPTPSPQTNGTWNDDSGAGGLSSNTLNTAIPPPGQTYPYTYTVQSPVGSTCNPTVSSTVNVSIFRGPESGTPTNLQLCSNVLGTYTNFDLFGQLTGQDSGGVWTDAGLGEITSATDSNINIQNIYNTRGPGIYRFTYTVLSNDLICSDKSSFVDITIEKQLDFTGATLVVNSDICENEIPTATYNAVLTQGTQVIPNGTYNVTYTISGVPTPIQTTKSFSGGVLTFPIPSTYFQQVNNYSIDIINIVDATSLGICNNIIGTIEDILHVYPIPKINNATLTITPVCQTFDVPIDFSGTSNLTDGNYDIVYNISGNNTATAKTAIISITGGLGAFTIPKALIPNAGANTITITKITNSTTGCTNTSTLNQSFTINPLPDATNLTATIKDICQGQATNVKLSGLGTLTSISINYNLSGSNITGSQIIPLTVIAGETNFVIPTTDIPNAGLTSFTITDLSNTVTGCTLSINNKTDFTVNSIPTIPIANDQIFCTSDNATVANLIPQGSQYQWFDSATSTVPLTSTTPLISGNYFVKEVNPLTGCESSLKPIVVQINATPQINSATLTIVPICQGYSANVNFSGTSNLADGNYNILYNLSGSNIATAIPATLSIASGLASFSIASNLIPNSGNTTIAITNITNALTNCTSTSTLSKVFIVNGLPDIANMVVTVKDGCLGQAINVDITGLGTLSNITLSYAVSGANAIGSQTIPLAVSGGKTFFLIPAGKLLNTGSNTLAITDLTNTGNGCSTIINTVSKNFAINAIPNSPTASNQKFCETNLATVANLAPNGNQYKWYDTPTSTIPLASSKLLVTGNYYVKEMNVTTGCESLSTPISVLINTVQIPVLKPNGEEFCGIDKPTIQNLSNNTFASANLVWYDALTNGTIIPNTDLLSEGATYYGFDYDATTQCYSSALPVAVSLTDCTLTPDKLKIPDGFSPNGDGVNDTFQIVDIEFSFPNYTLEIFNRYGNVLFKGDINKPDWNGKNSNSSFIDGDAPAGVYFYIIHYNKDNLPPKQGQLYLNR